MCTTDTRAVGGSGPSDFSKPAIILLVLIAWGAQGHCCGCCNPGPHVSLQSGHAYRLVVSVVARWFPRYNFSWLVDEMERNLPQELDFELEAANAERCKHNFASSRQVPSIRSEGCLINVR
jgi:ABC1 atypical kinase-like domain